MKITIKTGDKITNKCCQCGLEHIWLFKIVKGKASQDNAIEMIILPQSKEMYTTKS